MNPPAKSRVASGPVLVSRFGDAGCSERRVKAPKYPFIDPIKGVARLRQSDAGHGSRNALRSV